MASYNNLDDFLLKLSANHDDDDEHIHGCRNDPIDFNYYSSNNLIVADETDDCFNTDMMDNNDDINQAEIIKLFESTLMYVKSDRAKLEIDNLVVIQLFVQRLINAMKDHAIQILEKLVCHLAKNDERIKSAFKEIMLFMMKFYSPKFVWDNILCGFDHMSNPRLTEFLLTLLKETISNYGLESFNYIEVRYCLNKLINESSNISIVNKSIEILPYLKEKEKNHQDMKLNYLNDRIKNLEVEVKTLKEELLRSNSDNMNLKKQLYEKNHKNSQSSYVSDVVHQETASNLIASSFEASSSQRLRSIPSLDAHNYLNSSNTSSNANADFSVISLAENIINSFVHQSYHEPSLNAAHNNTPNININNTSLLQQYENTSNNIDNNIIVINGEQNSNSNSATVTLIRNISPPYDTPSSLSSHVYQNQQSIQNASSEDLDMNDIMQRVSDNHQFENHSLVSYSNQGDKTLGQTQMSFIEDYLQNFYVNEQGLNVNGTFQSDSLLSSNEVIIEFSGSNTSSGGSRESQAFHPVLPKLEARDIDEHIGMHKDEDNSNFNDESDSRVICQDIDCRRCKTDKDYREFFKAKINSLLGSYSWQIDKNKSTGGDDARSIESDGKSGYKHFYFYCFSRQTTNCQAQCRVDLNLRTKLAKIIHKNVEHNHCKVRIVPKRINRNIGCSPPSVIVKKEKKTPKLKMKKFKNSNFNKMIASSIHASQDLYDHNDFENAYSNHFYLRQRDEMSSVDNNKENIKSNNNYDQSKAQSSSNSSPSFSQMESNEKNDTETNLIIKQELLDSPNSEYDGCSKFTRLIGENIDCKQCTTDDECCEVFKNKINELIGGNWTRGTKAIRATLNMKVFYYYCFNYIKTNCKSSCRVDLNLNTKMARITHNEVEHRNENNDLICCDNDHYGKFTKIIAENIDCKQLITDEDCNKTFKAMINRIIGGCWTRGTIALRTKLNIKVFYYYCYFYAKTNCKSACRVDLNLKTNMAKIMHNSVEHRNDRNEIVCSDYDKRKVSKVIADNIICKKLKSDKEYWDVFMRKIKELIGGCWSRSSVRTNGSSKVFYFFCFKHFKTKCKSVCRVDLNIKTNTAKIMQNSIDHNHHVIGSKSLTKAKCMMPPLNNILANKKLAKLNNECKLDFCNHGNHFHFHHKRGHSHTRTIKTSASSSNSRSNKAEVNTMSIMSESISHGIDKSHSLLLEEMDDEDDQDIDYKDYSTNEACN